MFGLRIMENQEAFPNKISEELNLIPIQIGDPPTDLNNQKKQFRNWLLKKGFEDFAKGIKQSLIEAYYYGTLVKKEGEVIKLNTFLKEIEELRKSANEQSLPGLLSKLQTILIKRLSYEQQVSTINNARNCLIHNNGLVSDRHINDKVNNRLIIKGNRFFYYFEKDGQKFPMKLGVAGPENSPLMLSIENFEIAFNIGQQIEISLKDFNDLTDTCLFFALDLKECLPKIKGTTANKKINAI